MSQLSVVLFPTRKSIEEWLVHRLRGLFAANLPGHEDLVAIIPAPKSIDPRVLAWKGGSVLAKLESVNDMWVQKGDWVSIFHCVEKITTMSPI